jgi:hypothetical protein
MEKWASYDPASDGLPVRGRTIPGFFHINQRPPIRPASLALMDAAASMWSGGISSDRVHEAERMRVQGAAGGCAPVGRADCPAAMRASVSATAAPATQFCKSSSRKSAMGRSRWTARCSRRGLKVHAHILALFPKNHQHPIRVRPAPRTSGIFTVQTTDFFYPLVDDPYLQVHSAAKSLNSQDSASSGLISDPVPCLCLCARMRTRFLLLSLASAWHATACAWPSQCPSVVKCSRTCFNTVVVRGWMMDVCRARSAAPTSSLVGTRRRSHPTPGHQTAKQQQQRATA